MYQHGYPRHGYVEWVAETCHQVRPYYFTSSVWCKSRFPPLPVLHPTMSHPSNPVLSSLHQRLLTPPLPPCAWVYISIPIDQQSLQHVSSHHHYTILLW